MENTALAIRGEEQELNNVMKLGSAMAKSGYFADAKDEAQAVVKILAGRELGIGAVQAMTGIYIVNGRVALGANIMASQIKRSGKYDYSVLELSESRCVIAFYQNGKEIGKSSFDVSDAKKAQTKNMDKFARNMLFARAMSNGARWYCPDVFGGPVYTREELQDSAAPIDDLPDGCIEGTVVNVGTGEIFDPQPAPSPEPEPDDELTTEKQWRTIHMAAGGAKLNKPGLKAVLNETFGVTSTKELKQSQVLTAIEALKKLTPEQVEAYNKPEEEVAA